MESVPTDSVLYKEHFISGSWPLYISRQAEPLILLHLKTQVGFSSSDIPKIGNITILLNIELSSYFAGSCLYNF